MARKRPGAPARPTTSATPRHRESDLPRSVDEHLAVIPAEPQTDAECVAAFGHTRDEMLAGHQLNPFTPKGQRPSPLDTTAPWPHWRRALARNRARTELTEFCRARGLVDASGRPLRDWRERVSA